jgi:hypothetical protein
MSHAHFTCHYRWENLEAGSKDASDFLKWQSEMRQRDLEEELAEIERRRLHGKLSHEEAILARQDLILENKQKVKSMKEEVTLSQLLIFGAVIVNVS